MLFKLVLVLVIVLLLGFSLNCLPQNSIEGWKNLKKKKWCLTCQPIRVKRNDTQYYTSNTREVPLWLKQESNYTQLPKPLLTDQKFNVFKNQSLKEFVPCHGKCLTFSFDLNKISEIKPNKNLWIYYWATEKRNYKNPILPDPKTAFGNYENSGLRQSDKNGIIRFKLRNPQPYQEDGKMFPPHLHFCYKLNDNIWSEQIYTVFFFPILNYQKFKQIKDNHLAILMNALPKDKGELDGSIRCPYDELEKIDFKQTIRNELKKYAYKKFNRFIQDKRISYKQVPIVVFCKNRDCRASTQLFNYLLSKGYYNLLKYPGGLEEWDTYQIKNDLNSKT